MPVTPDLARERLGRSTGDAAAALSSASVGSSSPHFTSRSVTSPASTSSFAWSIQRAVKSSTVCCRSTFFTAVYRAPSTSVRSTHSVAVGAGVACTRV